MFDSIFRFLQLTPLTFSLSAARRNYRDILSVVHPDKCASERASLVTKYVTHAYVTLCDPVKRTYFIHHGRPSNYESYDEGEASQVLSDLSYLLRVRDFEKEEEKRKVIREETRSDRESNQERPSNSSGSNSPQQSDEQSPSYDRFDAFIKECRLAANERPSPPTEGSATEISKDDDFTQRASSTKTVSQDQLEPVLDKAEVSPNTGSEPELIVVESDLSDAETEESLGDIFRRQQRSPSVSILDEETSDSLPSGSVNGNGCDASTSPIKYVEEKTFVDVATSPFKPGDKVTFFILPGVSTSKKNLSFGDKSFTPADDSIPFKSNSQRTSTPRGATSDKSTPQQHNSSHQSKASGKARRRSTHKKYIKNILGLRTRCDGVRFKVVWGPGGHETIEHADVVIQEKRGLRNWLDLLSVEEPKRYNAILKFHPEFSSVLDD